MRDGYAPATPGLGEAPRDRSVAPLEPPSVAGSPVPGLLQTDMDPRCWHCNSRLAEYLTRSWSIRCRKCKAQVRQGDPPAGAESPAQADAPAPSGSGRG